MTEEMKMNLKKQELPVKLNTDESRAEVLSLRPLTDIHETKEAVTLYMDLPGVCKDSLNIDIDNNVLMIKAAVNLHTPVEISPSYMEMHSGVYEQRFTLGDELDSNNIEATLKHGELTLRIPHLQQHKPRKIEIKVA